ncbi:hypothetical protein [Polynucleobacter necessarius]|uniref:hypothetical protein n=1 Tax=Polynucleobacter necessarius TaxID=576610 RepID=UPI0013B052F7|nr:hypothetical protein [Polynucleobacter necessarius]
MNTQRWVAAFGGGFAGGASSTGSTAASSYGSYVYVLDLEPDSSKSTASCDATGSSVITSTGGMYWLSPLWRVIVPPIFPMALQLI